ncbi:hypothetical protein NUG22_16540 [Saccharothrix longispora]|nr:hypothetical protein [Saccharothrix longispora]
MSLPPPLSHASAAVLRTAVDQAISALGAAHADDLRLDAVLAGVADAAPDLTEPADPADLGPDGPDRALAEAQRMLVIGFRRAADGDVAATRTSFLAASTVLSRIGDATAA